MGVVDAAFAVQIATPYLIPIGGFTISAAHFVERHGLVIIIALGESVVAIGVGADELHLDIGLLAVAVAGLVVAYFLYWAYFGGDEERAEHALDSIADSKRRARMALQAYGYAHYPMLIGIIATAAGIKKEIAHAFGHVSARAGDRARRRRGGVPGGRPAVPADPADRRFGLPDRVA